MTRPTMSESPPGVGVEPDPGRYIALEGIDGAGKTSVQAGLRERFEAAGHEVVCVREPGGTPLGEQLRRALLHGDEMAPWTEALMFAADRSHLVSAVIRPALERGAWVISDRSVYSSLAYQGAGSGLGIDAVRLVNHHGLAGMWPGVVVLLRVSPGTGLQRQAGADSEGIQETLPIGAPPASQARQPAMWLEGSDRIGGRGIEFQADVGEAYAWLARREPERFVVVDAERSFDRVLDDVWAAVGAGRR